MSNFTPYVPFDTEFDGDKIVMNLSRLKRKDLFKLAPFFKGVDQNEDGSMSGEIDSAGIFQLAGDFLPDYVHDFTGCKDANGNALTFEQVSEEVYFLDLVTRIIVRLFEISNLQAEVDEKNSGRPLNTSVVAQAISEATSSLDSPAKTG